MYLLDTNILVELLLDQERADDAEKLLKNISSENLSISEFSLYSLGIILFRQKMYDDFLQVVNDLLDFAGMNLIRLGLENLPDLIRLSKKFNLDFDDAYQYVAAEKYNLTLVSFDSDFDRTERGRKTPAQILETL